MRRMDAPVKLCVAILIAALCWRMLGAPLTKEDFQNLETPMRQARLLLPQRVERMLRLWLPGAQTEAAQTMTQEAGEVGEPSEENLLLVYLTQEDRLARMTLEGYVCGVVAAEMPAQYHLEALKAQAVAARTRALWQKEQGGCALHPGADICTDSTHCQGYATLGQCREMWGGSYEAYRDRLLQAQKETAGQWIAYGDKPITVLYHAISGGRTENVQTVFAESLPYLVSVESIEDESARGYQQETAFTFEEIARKLNSTLDGAQLTAQDVQRSLSIGGYTDSGRVSHVQIGEQRIEATVLRRALGLRSTWFTISADDQGVVFHQRGYGHGVGMSQAGANSMAASGADYAQIIRHYYTGVDIVTP